MADIVNDLPKDTLVDHIIYYGLFVGAIFQMICIFAVILVPSTFNEQTLETKPELDDRPHLPDSKVKHKQESQSTKRQSKHDKKKRK